MRMINVGCYSRCMGLGGMVALLLFGSGRVILAASKKPSSVVAIPSRTLNSFESPSDISWLKLNHVKVEPVTEFATDGESGLQVEFEPVEWPGITFPAGRTPWDWSKDGSLALDVRNPGPKAITFAVRVDDDLSADGTNHCRTGTATLRPGEKGSFSLPLRDADPVEAFGMHGLPTWPGLQPMEIGGSKIDLSHIVAVQIFLPKPPASQTLLLDHVRLVPSASLKSVVDEFGQSTLADWPGKVHSLEELRSQDAREDRDLKKAKRGRGLDAYGGWADGPKLAATGYFRTAQEGGKWWLVTPEGHLFFSLGINVVGSGIETIVTGRDESFNWLPSPSDPLARYYAPLGMVQHGPIKTGKTFNFYGANLYRKYGEATPIRWREKALNRLEAWGFNTIGNWSETAFFNNGRVSYVATAYFGGGHGWISGDTTYWGEMHDAFDPKFQTDVEATLKDLAASRKNDPWLVGYFVDNEISWGSWGNEGHFGLANGTLAGAKELVARQYFLKQLQEKYGSIEKLNAAWVTEYSSWDAMAPPTVAPEKASSAMKTDMSAFEKALARQYFRVVRDAILKYDPNHLYLGCRFAWQTPEAVQASAEFCDVVSFNIYEPRLDPKKWGFTKDLGKPCIIGEFQFGALDRGTFSSGLMSSPDQKARAEMYKTYVRSVADLSAFVGCHWFQYVDEPLLGRSLDGENYNIGFVSVADVVYPELAAAAKAANGEIYTRRGQK